MTSDDGETWSLFVGVNQYRNLPSLGQAVADASELQGALTAEGNGALVRSRSTLLLDHEATKRAFELSLADTFRRRSPNENALIYFAGHAIRTSRGEVHLAFSGASVEESEELGGAAENSIPIDRLRSEYLAVSGAHYVVAILDCCFAGQIHPEGMRAGGSDADYLQAAFQPGSRNIVAISACSANQVARESEESGHGYFTAHLLDAVRGAAADADGVVTVHSAFDYVGKQRLSQTPRMTAATEAASLPLVRIPELAADEVIDLRRSAEAGHSHAYIEPEHHLTPFVPFLDRLVAAAPVRPENQPNELDYAATWSNERALRSLCRIADADLAVVRRIQEAGGSTIVSVAADGGRPDRESEARLIERLEPALGEPLRSRPRSDALCLSADADGVDIAIVVRRAETAVVLYLGGSKSSEAPHEVGIRALRSFYSASCALGASAPVVEAAILDDLRREFGYFPRGLYERRRELFLAGLQGLEMVFQPVIDFLRFDEGRPAAIYGWEALARTRLATSEAPPLELASAVDLFKAAELWRGEFMAELDAAVFPKAIEGLKQALSASSVDLSHLTLSINCYAQSLLRPTYLDVVADTLSSAVERVRADSVVLELSEKTELPAPEGLLVEGERALAAAFLDRLVDIRQKLHVGFAIDDFGVGHSSPVRLDALQPTHVKIDRDVVLDRSGKVTMEFVVALLSYERLKNSVIVVEGFEAEGSGCSLGDILGAGIHHVQGFGLFLPDPELVLGLSESDQSRFRDLANGFSPRLKHPTA